MSFFRKKRIDYDSLVRGLNSGDSKEIGELLWKPVKNHAFLPVTYAMLSSLRKPQNEDQGLSIFSKWTHGKFEMIIFNTPWAENEVKYSPLIINDRGKIVGVMLQFNEIHKFLEQETGPPSVSSG